MREFRLTLLDLLTLPVSLPLKAAAAGLAEVVEEARRECSDPGVLYRKLAELQTAYELGEVDEAEFHRRSRLLEARLDALRSASGGEEPGH